MTNLDSPVDNLKQLLHKIDQAAANECLDYPVSMELTDRIRKIIETDSAEAVKQLVDRWAADRYR